MDPARYRRVKEIVLEALEHPPEARDRAAADRCAGDARLLADVRALLHAQTRTVEFASPGVPLDPDAAIAADLRPGDRIGQYTIVQCIGAGGMGAVYEAEGTRPRRLVALKVLKSDAASPHSLRRFEYEAELLGRLQHPHIAQVYEAGSFQAAGGPRPFFAMELVRGEPIVTFADRKGMRVRDRAALMRPVCDAVHHAHLSGIIHRDLKPSNILVEASGRPKVIDFGVARAVDGSSTLTAQSTGVGRLVGTLGYMAPEQAGGDQREVDHRADVYALGVVLYELLAGRMPHDLANKWVVEALRVVRDTDPTPLSAVNRALRGDLERIVMRALDRDRERRYGSAEALAEDLGRFLRDEPVRVRPPSAVYVARKFVRRHRLLASAVGGAALAMVAGTAAALGQAQRAERRADEARAMSGFILNLVDRQPGDTADEAVRLELPLLDRIAQRLPDLARFPRGEMELRSALEYQYGSHSKYTQAAEHGRRAVQLKEALDPRDRAAIAALRVRLAGAYNHNFQPREAEAALRPLVADAATLAALPPLQRADVMREYGEVLTALDRPAEGVRWLARAGEVYATLPREHAVTLVRVYDRLGGACRAQGRTEEAERWYRRGIAEGRDRLPPDAVWHGPPRRNLGAMLIALGRCQEAEALLRESLTFGVAELGEHHAQRLGARHLLASALACLGRDEEAEDTWTDVIALARAHHPAPSTFTGVFCTAYAGMLIDLARTEEALPLLVEARGHLLGTVGPDHEYTQRLWAAVDKLAAAGVAVPGGLARPAMK